MFSVKFQEKIRKPVIGVSNLMHKTGLAGIWLRLISATQRFIIWRSPFIKSLKPSNIIDIGANTGEFALLARAAFPMAKIISFEPQPDAYTTLVKTMIKDKNFLSYQVGLGEKNEKAVMYISKFSPSSSFVVQSKDSHPQEMEIKQLNNYKDLIDKNDITIIKMDVEGYELSVLKGGEAFIEKANWIYIECRTNNFLGCKFSEIYDFLINRNWEYRGAYDSEYSKEGKLMYFDAFFKNLKKENQ